MGGGFQEIAVILSDTPDYTVKYDAEGKPYKEYYFEDPNLAPYTEYEYAIQVERLQPIPPLSSPSAVYAAHTKAAEGYPDIVLQESDGQNDGQLLVYTDKNAYVTARVTGPGGEAPADYYTTVQYQWQRLEDGAWEDLPAGGYVLRMAGEDGLSIYAPFTIARRALTLQLPTQKGEEGSVAGDEPTDAPSVPFGSVPVVSGSWAPCDMPDGVLKNEIAAPGIYLDYINTAGKVYSRWTVDSLCGYYTIRAQEENNAAREILANYDITYLDGSITILGATQTVRIGARPFEGQQVGTVHAISPEYGSTRTDLSEQEVLVQNHPTGTRLLSTAVPDAGYEIYDWYINGISQGTTASSLAYVLLAENTTVEVQFVIRQSNLIFGTAGDADGGTILCDDPDLTSDSSVLTNARFTFTAKARPGYHFKEWRYNEEGKGTIYDDSDKDGVESTFELLMPAVSCSIYAVFERDFYTFHYNDGNGANGLTAWYYGSLTGDATDGTEKITIVSGQQIKGDTVITVGPKPGYALDDSLAYGSTGSQGTADYSTGTYTLTLTEDTSVTGYTIQRTFDVVFEFRVSTQDVFPEGTVLTCSIGSDE